MKRLVTLATVTGTALWGLLAIQAPPAGATTPGSNGRIAFWSDVGFGGQIYTIKPNGLGIRQLTQFNGSAQTPEWSPDGTESPSMTGRTEAST